MIPNALLWLSLLSAATVKAQTLSQDCAVARTIWQKMGKTTILPTSCCSAETRIECSSTRITAMYVRQSYESSQESTTFFHTQV